MQGGHNHSWRRLLGAAVAAGTLASATFVAGAAGSAGGLGASPAAAAAAAAAPVPPFVPASAPWLASVNYFRAMAGLSPVTENPAWSNGAYLHSRYMVENNTITHDEVDGGPWWTPEGDVAGNSGNVAVSSGTAATARSHIELWMTGPFHAIGILRHNLRQVGYGQYANAASARWRSGATLDVIQGLDWSVRRPSSPILFPGHGTTTSLYRFITESPNPLTFCGWSGTAGLPVIAMMPEVPANATASISGPSGPIEACTLTSANTNGTASSILASDHAVVVVPRTQLQPGVHWVTVTTAYRSVSWSFTVDPNAANASYGALPNTEVVGASAKFQPLQPFRLLDTRNGDAGGRLRAGQDVRIRIAGQGSVPAGATAVSANFIVVNPTTSGHLTVYPCGGSRPLAATLNYGAGRDVANQAMIALGASGEICVSSHSDADLVIDVNGAFSSGAAQKATAVTPTRLLDTRSGLGGHGRVGIGQTIELAVRGFAGVPGDATAVAMNLTAVDPATGGFVTAYPCGSRPVVSNLNTSPLETRPNSVVVSLSGTGSVCLYTTVDTDLVVDVNGYFTGAGTRQFAALKPIRMLDTRESDSRMNAGMGGSRLVAGRPLRLALAGQRGIPSGASAITVNIAATDATSPGFLTAYPCGSVPVAANLNFTPGVDIANGAQVMLDAQGGLCLYSSTNVHVVLDVNGAWV